jgi:hypothetical protein
MGGESDIDELFVVTRFLLISKDLKS